RLSGGTDDGSEDQDMSSVISMSKKEEVSRKLLEDHSNLASDQWGCGDEDDDEGEYGEGISLYHTFIIFSTGSVTQSGPRPHEIGMYYEEFNRIVHENRDKIMLHTNRFQKKKPKLFTHYYPVVQPAFPFENVCK